MATNSTGSGTYMYRGNASHQNNHFPHSWPSMLPILSSSWASCPPCPCRKSVENFILSVGSTVKQQVMPLPRNPQGLPITYLIKSTLLLAFRVLKNLAGPDSPSSTASLDLHRASFTPTIRWTDPSLHFHSLPPFVSKWSSFLDFPSKNLARVAKTTSSKRPS